MPENTLKKLIVARDMAKQSLYVFIRINRCIAVLIDRIKVDVYDQMYHKQHFRYRTPKWETRWVSG